MSSHASSTSRSGRASATGACGRPSCATRKGNPSGSARCSSRSAGSTPPSTRYNKALEKRGAELWSTLDDGGDVPPDDVLLIELLRVAIELDQLGDAMAVWADDRTGPRPDDAVDATAATAAERLDVLGVAREEPPPRRSGRGA